MDLYGNKITSRCMSCDISSGKLQVVGEIYKSQYFEIHQDQEACIPGFIIIASKRHVISFADLTDEELEDFIYQISKIKKALKIVLNINQVYFIQKEAENRHFHAWLFPRYDWMLDIQKYGTSISSISFIYDYSRDFRNTPENLKEVEKAIEKLKKVLL